MSTVRCLSLSQTRPNAIIIVLQQEILRIEAVNLVVGFHFQSYAQIFVLGNKVYQM